MRRFSGLAFFKDILYACS